MARRVLFVSHEASRTGSPIIALHLLRWLRANTDVEVDVLLIDGGPLVADFASVGKVHLLRDITGESRRGSAVSRIRKRMATVPAVSPDDGWLRSRVERPVRQTLSSRQGSAIRDRLAALGPWDLVYLNSMASSRALKWIPPGIPVLTHVHELLSQPNNQLWMGYEQDVVDSLKRRSTCFIAVSDAARQSVIEDLDVAPERVELCREFLPTTAPSVDAKDVDATRKRLEIPPGAFVVGASGTCEWRKGPDLFLQLAISARRRGLTDRLRFVWVGADPERIETLVQLFDVKRAGMSGIVHFLDVQDDPRPFYEMFDVFALTSRSDPYPLVCLEMATLRTPIICFEGGGGMPEFAGDGAGIVAPYADVEAMLDQIVELVDDPDLRRLLGERAAEKVAEENEVGVVGPQVWSIMQRLMAEWGREPHEA